MTRPQKILYIIVIPLVTLAMVMAYNRCGEYMRAYNESRPSPTVNPWLEGDSVKIPLQ